MGGQSFQCPLCRRWWLAKDPLRDHIKDAHKIAYHFTIEGTGGLTSIKSENLMRQMTPANRFLRISQHLDGIRDETTPFGKAVIREIRDLLRELEKETNKSHSQSLTKDQR